MKIVSTIARYLLGVIFLVFGLNGFLHFIPMPPPASPLAGQLMGALFGSSYYVVIFLLQITGGALLLAGRYVPLALTLLGPLVANIFLYHAFLDHPGLPLALLVCVLWILTALSVRSAFAGIFQQRVTA